jgi:hypothetical protein
MASLILTGVFGTGGSSWGEGLRSDLDGVWGVDLVRTRAGEVMLGDGFNGDAARVRFDDGTNTFGLDDGEREDDGGGIRDMLFQTSKSKSKSPSP